MGNLASKFFSFWFPNIECRTLMLGLDGAGKTTVLYKLKLGETVCTIPTIGFNVETVTFQKISITVWDVGGQEKIRALWKYYFPNTTALIYVVDSQDVDRLEEAKQELHHLLVDMELSKANLLVFANKQDLPNAKSPAQIADALELETIKNRNWYIVGTNAQTGDGLFEGLMWLKKHLKSSI